MLPCAICAAAVAIVSELLRMLPIMPTRFCCIIFIAYSRLERSAGAVCTSMLRSLAAIFIAMAAAYSGLPPSVRCRLRLTPTTMADSSAHMTAKIAVTCLSDA